MGTKNSNFDRLRDLCEKVIKVLDDQHNPQFSALITNLDWCIGSYEYDKNPVGLIEYGEIALTTLIEYSKNKSFTGDKNLIFELDKYLREFEPLEIIKQGQNASKRYSEHLTKQGKDYIYEAKIMLVGEPGAGKTTLMNLMFDKAYPVPNVKEKATLGIEIRPNWEFIKDKIAFKAHIWDFGGQEIQYMLHQFFLTSDCLYILLAEKRKELTNFDYWLNIIKILGKNSPILILFNEINIDTATSFIFNEKKYREELFPGLSLLKLDVNFSNLQDGRYDVLINTIKEKITQLRHIGKEVPAKWVDIRNELEFIRWKNHIKIDEYFDICNKYKIYNEDDCLLILKYFHLLGTVLHFSEDQNLCDTIFLDPNWTIDAVYSVLTDPEIENNNGIFNKDKVDRIWKAKNYGYEERAKLLQLMLKDNFDLCYKLPSSESKYIVPLLLFKIKPEYSWNNIGNLQFRFQYPFMPRGIVSRLIVRLNEYIEKYNETPIIWNEGAVFNKEGAKAQVIEQQTLKGLKVIEIRLIGHPDLRKEFLTLIREEIKRIQKSSFSNLPYYEMIPCNCQECSVIVEPEFYEYKVLENLLFKNINKKQCPHSGSMLDIENLIDTIFGSA